MGEVLKKGKLSTGKRIDIVVSDKSSISEGQHVICNVLGPDDSILNHAELTREEKAEAFAFITDYLQERHPDGKWTLLLNGPGMTTRPTFHLHGTLPDVPGQNLRFIFNPSAYLRKLQEVVKPLEETQLPPAEVKALKSLIEEFEQNLK